MKTKIGLLVNGLILVISFWGVVKLQQQSIAANNQVDVVAEGEKSEQQEALRLKILNQTPKLGFDNLLADWLYLQFIQYFGDGTVRDAIGYSLSPEYYRQIAQLDPKFVDALLRLNTSTSLFTGEPKTSVAILNQALESVPPQYLSPGNPPFWLWIYKGIDELLFLGQPLIAKQSYATAADWAELEDPVKYQTFIKRTRDTAKFLGTNPESRATQIGAWATILGFSSDKRTQEKAIKEIISLGGEVSTSPEGFLKVRVPEWIK